MAHTRNEWKQTHTEVTYFIMDLFETLSSNGIHFIRIYIEILFAINYTYYYNQNEHEFLYKNEKNFEIRRKLKKMYHFHVFCWNHFVYFYLKLIFKIKLALILHKTFLILVFLFN